MRDDIDKSGDGDPTNIDVGGDTVFSDPEGDNGFVGDSGAGDETAGDSLGGDARFGDPAGDGHTGDEHTGDAMPGKLAVAGPSVVGSAQNCVEYTVATPVQVSSDTTVEIALGPADDATIYESGLCTTTQTSFVLSTGESTVSLWVARGTRDTADMSAQVVTGDPFGPSPEHRIVFLEPPIPTIIEAGVGAGDEGGFSIAVFGDTLVVGTPGVSTSAADAGAVDVLEWNGVSWVSVTTLAPDSLTADARFGADVAIDADTIVVGAPTHAGNGTAAGAAYVYHWVTDTWVEQPVLMPSDAGADQRFGYSVGVSGDEVLVGAPGRIGPMIVSTGTAGPGAVYRFSRNAVIWSQVDRLTHAHDNFGKHVATHSGHSVIIGMREAFENLSFRRRPTAHFYQGSTPGLSADLSGFSADAAMHGQWAAFATTDASVTMFERIGLTWESRPSVLSGAFGGPYTDSVALNGNYLMAGNWTTQKGYLLQGGTWVYRWEAVSGVSSTPSAVAITDDGRALVGCPQSNGGAGSWSGLVIEAYANAVW